MSDYAELAAIVWPDDGYSTRSYAAADYGELTLRRILVFRLTPWPAIELFPRVARIEALIAKWQGRTRGAWSALRGDDDYRY